MLRKYALKEPLKLSRYLSVTNLLEKRFVWETQIQQYFSDKHTELLSLQDSVLNVLPNYLYRNHLEIQLLITKGTIESHIDGYTKQMLLIPIKCSPNTILWEEDREVILEVNKLYTLNDFNKHGLITQRYNTKTIFIGIS